MIVYAPKPRPQAAGFWAFEDQTERLVHVDAHEESTVHTRWPVLDRWHRRMVERGVDWLLNAAGAGRERLDAALRVAYPGSRLDGLPPVQSMFWHRLVHGLSGGAQASLYLGNGQDGSFGGLVVDDAHDDTSVTGWSGGAAGLRNDHAGRAGEGPGRGEGGDGHRGSGDGNGRNGGGGGYAQTGLGYGGTGIIPPEWSFSAILMNSYTRESLALGGGGGGGGGGVSPGGRDRAGGAGGASGNGHVRISTGSLVEATDQTLRGANGTRGNSQDGFRGGDGGSGSGGLYFAMAGESITISSTIDCRGGTSGADGGNGRVILLFGDSVDTSAGTIGNAELTTYQLLPAVPFGGLLVS